MFPPGSGIDGGTDMVNNAAQLYTIEGISAAVIMLVTAYIVLNSTTLFTPADTHVTDMQLEQLGNDALAMMDTTDAITPVVQPVPPAPQFTSYEMKMSSFGEDYILNGDAPAILGFNTDFNNYVNYLYDSDPFAIKVRVILDLSNGVRGCFTAQQMESGVTLSQTPIQSEAKQLPGRSILYELPDWSI